MNDIDVVLVGGAKDGAIGTAEARAAEDRTLIAVHGFDTEDEDWRRYVWDGSEVDAEGRLVFRLLHPARKVVS